MIAKREQQTSVAETPETQKKQIVYVLHFEPRGTRTFDTFLVNFHREMTARGWEFTFVTAAEPTEQFRQSLQLENVRFVVTSFPFSWRSLAQCLKQFNGAHYDLMITSFVSPFCWPAVMLKVLGRTRRLVINDQTSGETPVRYGWRRLATYWRGRMVGRIIDAIVPVSHYNAKRDAERVFLPAGKVRVVHNGVDLARLQPVKRVPGPAVRISYAGQLIPQKGVHTLLRAVAKLEQGSSVSVETRIAGKGSQRSELEKLANELGLKDCQFLGHIDSIPEFFASSDIVVIPSEWAEAFGLTIAEAMATGAACVVSDAGACPEVVGEAGLVFRKGDAASLCEKLKLLVDQPHLRTELGAAARERVERYFSLNRRVEQLAALCDAVHRGQLPDAVTPPDDTASN